MDCKTDRYLSSSHRLLGCLLASLVVFVCLIGCQKKEKLKIGFVGDLTGPMSELGINGRNGVLLAVEELNAAGGINGQTVELVTKDDKHQGEQALKVDKELINEGVVAIIGHMTSAMSVKAVPLMNDAEMVMISPTTSKLAGIDDYFIRILPYGKSNHFLASYTYQRLGLENVAIVYDLSNAAFSELMKKDFTTEFATFGGQISIAKPYLSGPNVNYIEIVETLLQSQPQALLIIAGPLDTAMICQHIRMSGSQIPIMLNGWTGAKELIEHGGPAVEGVFYTNMFNQNSKIPRYVDFKSRFQKRFGSEPNFAAVYSYEAAQLLFKALSESVDPTELKGIILNSGKLEGLQGDISFDKYGDAHRKTSIVAIQNRQIVILE